MGYRQVELGRGSHSQRGGVGGGGAGRDQPATDGGGEKGNGGRAREQTEGE